MTPETLNPAAARAMLDAGARLIDIRGADEHARERIPGAVNHPLERIGDLAADGRPVLFHCKSGMRTAANAARLAAAGGGAPVYILGGGIDAWRGAGLPVAVDRTRPIEIMRQMQITAGLLVLAGVVLGFAVAPAWFALAGFIGAGLTVSGATGWCGMANLLRLMPWYRRAAG